MFNKLILILLIKTRAESHFIKIAPLVGVP